VTSYGQIVLQRGAGSRSSNPNRRSHTCAVFRCITA